MPSSTETEVAADPQAVILVEGASDQRAVEVLARKRGRDLAAEGVAVVAMGGITNLSRHLDALAAGVRVAGLYDSDAEAWVQRAIARRETPVALRVCGADLEDELIRALGVPAALEVVETHRDSAAWAILCRQPYHRGRPAHEVLHRFLGTTSGRNIEYAGLLTAAAYDLDRVPSPLDGVLTDTLG